MKFSLLMLIFLVIATDNVFSQCPNCPCFLTNQFVCSTHGVTFNNACYMQCYYHTWASNGPCPTPPSPPTME